MEFHKAQMTFPIPHLRVKTHSIILTFLNKGRQALLQVR